MMKVNPIQQTHLNQYQKAVDNERIEKGQRQQQDKLEISARAKQLSTIPDLENNERQKKVSELKQQYESGTYKVNHARAAEKLIAYWTE